MIYFYKKGWGSLCLMMIFPFLSFYSTAQSTAVSIETDRTRLMELAESFQVHYDSLKAIALEKAQQLQLPVYFVGDDSVTYELMYFEGEEPVYYETNNLDAAASTSTRHVWPGQRANLSLTGLGMTVHEWDGGAVRLTHQEYNGRVVQGDGATSISSHATHVAGTMVASGVDTSAIGMAYQANLRAFDWNNDNSEMASEASNGALVSNHSYGQIAGWRFGNFGGNHTGNAWYWYGTPSISQVEDWKFGFYNNKARQWDQIAEAAPFYLIVKSAGNNRGQGITSGWHFVNYGSGWDSSNVARQLSGGPNGFDCIPTYGTAKNILTVGAVNDVPNGYVQPSGVVMSSFSSFGPTDDGRIKPDLVGNGVSLRSSTSASNTSYGNSSGTSMSAPNVSGSLILLQQHYHNIYDAYMRSATLKGLAIHTADECGTAPGPDYRFGWGLLNTEKAALVISDSLTTEIHEATLQNQGVANYNIFSDGVSPIKVTLSWVDPAGTVHANALNVPTPKLVNDLDVRILNLNDTTFLEMPWILNPAQPSAAATKGDNFRDNVEVIDAGTLPIGNYVVRVSHKGSLSGGSQPYSLIITGKSNANCINNFNVSMQVVDSLRCFGDAGATLMAQVTGGVPPYTYNWNNFPNVTGNTLTNLGAGTYQVIVTDSVFCTQTLIFTLHEPSDISLNITQSQGLTCNSDSNASFTVQASGGAGNYTYIWNTNPPQMGPSITNLGAGQVSVTVIDGDSCHKTFTLSVNSPPPLGVQIGQVKNTSCAGQADGEIALLAFGGAAPYQYNWISHTGLTGNILTGLDTGAYTLVITDANGCTDTSVYHINEPAIWALDTIAGVDFTGVGETNNYSISPKPSANYLWSVSGGSIVGSSSNSSVNVLWNQLGVQELSVRVRSSDSCAIETKQISVSELFNIEEDGLNQVRIYPNPNTGQFTLDLGNIPHAHVEIISLRGQTIYRKSTEGEREIQLDLQVASGVYVVKVSAQGLSKNVRLVVQ